MTATAPLVSLCVPTHDGRVQVLGELLSGALAQAASIPDQVEICVSDNASQDGTQALVAELAEGAPCRLAYTRHASDAGLAANLLSAVGLARGRYCWLLGSDDLLAARALERVCELIGELPHGTGYAVGALHVDATDPSLRSRALPRAFHPPGDRARMVVGTDAVYDECGNSWCAISWTLAERQSWLRWAKRLERQIHANPVFPQVVVLAAMAAEQPRWGWLAETLVLQRNATTFLFEDGRAPLASRWTTIIAAVAAAWAGALGGRDTARWRRRMRLISQVWGRAVDIRATKLYERPPLAAQAGLAKACLQSFWPVRHYWREVLPASLQPVWLTRALYGVQARSPARVELAAAVPQRLSARSVHELAVTVRNTGDRSTAQDGTSAVAVTQQWYPDGSGALSAEQLELNESASLPQLVPLRIRPGRQATAHVALYAPCSPGVYRLELRPHQHGYGWLDEVAGATRLTALVEVAAAATPGPAHEAAPSTHR